MNINEVNTNPLDNMYMFVNKSWLNKTTIPDDKSIIDSFHTLTDENVQKQKMILESFSKSTNQNENKLEQIYQKLMNQSDDVSMINKYIDIINKASNHKDIFELIGSFHKLCIHSFFAVDSQLDILNSEIMNLTIYPSDLSLPDRDYYLDDKFKSYIDSFEEHLKIVDNKVKENYKTINTKINISDVLEIETILSMIHRSADEKRDIDKYYNKFTISSFINDISESISKYINPNKIIDSWKAYFKIADVDSANSLVVYDMNFFRKITILIYGIPVDMLKSYLIYLFIKSNASICIKSYNDIFFDYYGKIFAGQKVQKPVHEKAIIIINSSLKLGEIIGKEYIKLYFSEESKKCINSMIKLLVDEMRESINKSQWMSNATKRNALLKLSKFRIKIGYPDEWYDYSPLFDSINFTYHDILEVIMRIKKFNYVKNVLMRIDKPKDLKIWHMNPQEVNAYYDQSQNEIAFPAGILQPPFFDANGEPYNNFGGIGIIIGHEITHGYDNHGRKYNHLGNLFDWWTPEDEIKFNKKADEIINQYNSYSVIIDENNKLNINGKLTVGENIADLGGIILAYRAMQKYYMNNNIHYNKFVNQKFFIKFADIWKSKMTLEKLTSLILSDPHSPGEFRVSNLRNIDYFYDAFQEYEQSRNQNNINSLYLKPEDRIRIWT